MHQAGWAMAGQGSSQELDGLGCESTPSFTKNNGLLLARKPLIFSATVSSGVWESIRLSGLLHG